MFLSTLYDSTFLGDLLTLWISSCLDPDFIIFGTLFGPWLRWSEVSLNFPLEGENSLGGYFSGEYPDLGDWTKLVSSYISADWFIFKPPVLLGVIALRLLAFWLVICEVLIFEPEVLRYLSTIFLLRYDLEPYLSGVSGVLLLDLLV